MKTSASEDPAAHQPGARHAAGRSAVAAAVGEILARADADIAARKPVCNSSGRCCHFEEYGHRLYVTAAELAFFAEAIGAPPAQGHSKEPGRPPAKSLPLPLFQPNGSVAAGCPFQVEGLCTARTARPLGCRIYFCDANAQSWQGEVYERYHGELRALHERLGLPYAYTEWRNALAQLLEQGVFRGRG